MTALRAILLSCGIAIAGGAAAPADPAEAPLLQGVTFGAYSGWTNCLALNGRAQSYQVVMVPALGGRVMHYSHELINILFQNPAAEGRTLDNAEGPFYAGGYQCDLGPETAGVPPRLGLLLGRHEWRAPRDFTVESASPIDPGVGIRLLKSLTLDPDTGELGVLQRMVNGTSRELAHSLHDRTVCKGGGFVFFRLNPDSRHPQGWSLFKSASGRYFYEPGGEPPENLQVIERHLVIDTGSGAAKVGADVADGWVAYALGRLLFVKYFPLTPGADYADGGNSLAVMWNGTVTELSPLGPRVRLAPGGHHDFPARWILKPLKREVRSFRDVRRVLDQVPANPFAAGR
jgi:hypothetical protein